MQLLSYNQCGFDFFFVGTVVLMDLGFAELVIACPLLQMAIGHHCLSLYF